MDTPIRWILLVAALLLVVGLIVWARGDDHHRGDEVGTLARTTAITGR